MKRFWLLVLLLSSCSDYKPAIECIYENKEEGSTTSYFCEAVGLKDGQLACFSPSDIEWTLVFDEDYRCFPLREWPHTEWYEDLFN